MGLRRLPYRRCFLCWKRLPKADLVRIGRSPDSRVAVDLTGKRPGRGTYLCHTQRCWQQALKGNRLNSAMNIAVPPEDKQALISYYEREVMPALRQEVV